MNMCLYFFWHACVLIFGYFVVCLGYCDNMEFSLLCSRSCIYFMSNSFVTSWLIMATYFYMNIFLCSVLTCMHAYI